MEYEWMLHVLIWSQMASWIRLLFLVNLQSDNEKSTTANQSQIDVGLHPNITNRFEGDQYHVENRSVIVDVFEPTPVADDETTAGSSNDQIFTGRITVGAVSVTLIASLGLAAHLYKR